MAVAYIKALVQLNLGADDAAFDHSIEVKEDEGVDADESYFKFGDAALKHIFDDSTTNGALFFFWAPHHGDENAADVLHCAAPWTSTRTLKRIKHTSLTLVKRSSAAAAV